MRAYFDHNATTPVAPEIAHEMGRVAAEAFGNPSSIHRDGQASKKLLEEARARVAAMLGCGTKEITFTSGGTEADNLAIFGVARRVSGPSRHVITTAIEHPAVLEACGQLEREGIAVTYLTPDRLGVVEAEQLRREIRPETILVSVMHANNETGVVQPIREMAEVCREAGVLFHSDGVQAAGKLAVHVRQLGVDLYSISGHKLNAPKGIGALYVRDGVKLAPMIHGGKQERQTRPGTENLLGAWSLGIAAGFGSDAGPGEVAQLRDRLERGILERVPDASVNGAGVERVPNTTNIRFDGIEGESMVIALDLKGFAVSTGAACSSGSLEPSHVLLAMGLSPAQAKSSIRFSLGLGNTAEQVDSLIDAVAQCTAHLRRLSPAYVS